jgi:hypothetical protein
VVGGAYNEPRRSHLRWPRFLEVLEHSHRLLRSLLVGKTRVGVSLRVQEQNSRKESLPHSEETDIFFFLAL